VKPNTNMMVIALLLVKYCFQTQTRSTERAAT